MVLTSTLQKLLHKAPPPITATRILASLDNPKTSLLPNFNNPSESGSSNAGRLPASFSNSVNAENFVLTHLHRWAFSPAYPFGLCSDAVSPTGSTRDGAGDGDAPGMWADSVKKKRKKKMNKHKYRKLRKRIGRQT